MRGSTDRMRCNARPSGAKRATCQASQAATHRQPSASTVRPSGLSSSEAIFDSSLFGVTPIEHDRPVVSRTLFLISSATARTVLLDTPAAAISPPLRAALSDRIADFGVRAAPSQILTAMGATQALDLVSRTLLTPGDAVLVDEPGWSVEYARLTHLGMRLLPVPRGPDGPDLAVMDTS